MGGEATTEEEIREMEKRAAFERAATAAQAAKDARIRDERATFTPAGPPEPATSQATVDVNSLPEAPPETVGTGVIGVRKPPSLGSAAWSGAKSAVRSGLSTIPGANTAIDIATSKSPNTEDVEDPQLLARRQAGLTASGAPAHPEEAPPPPQGEADMGGSSFRPSPGVYVPGGMQPYSEKRDVKEGIPVGPEIKQAYGRSEGMKQEAAGLEHQAMVGLQPHVEEAERQKLAAMDRARVEHQRLADERNFVVQERMAQIEQLNKEAQGKPEDLWSSGQAFARVIGTLLSAVGFIAGSKGSSGGLGLMAAGGIINGLVNQDIEAKREARGNAAAQAKRQTDLLHLHEQNFKDQDQAIDATKLAYYDNILQNMEVLKAGPYANQINEAKYLQLQGNLLNERAQLAERIQTKETAQIQGESVHHYRPPQVLGGGMGGALKDLPGVVTLPDGKGGEVAYQMPNEVQQNEAHKRIVILDRYARMNKDILEQRKVAEANPPWSQAYRDAYARLDDLETQKGPLLAQMLDGSTLRKEEAERYNKSSVKATDGLGLPGKIDPVYSPGVRRAATAVLNAQTKQAEDDMRNSVRGGRIVQRGYVTDPTTGARSPVATHTGQDTHLDEHLAPRGFKPDDPSLKVPTAKPSDRETAPQAPSFGEQRPAPARGGKKKKEE